MNKDKAVQIVMDKYPNYTVDKVTETDDYYLISISDKEKFKNTIVKPIAYDDGLKAVNKVTGSIFTYNPIKHG